MWLYICRFGLDVLKANHCHKIFVWCLEFSVIWFGQVTSPYGNNLHHQENVTHGQFAFTTQEAGNYLACFWIDSSHHLANPITLGVDWKMGIAAKDWDSVAKKEKIEASLLFTSM